jgi:hypothetical protein
MSCYNYTDNLSNDKELYVIMWIFFGFVLSLI